MTDQQTQAIVEQLSGAGLKLSLASTGGLAVAPSSHLTEYLRDLIRINKSILLDWIKVRNDMLNPTFEVRDDPLLDPDRWCYPRSTAMNTVEIDTFNARLSRFTEKGMTIADGEGLADKLVSRDREQDDRHSCFECVHLAGAGGWRCGNWQAAGVAIRSRDAQLPADLVVQLQRCNGFTAYISPIPKRK